MNKEWYKMSALDLGQAIGRREINAIELCEYFLERIARLDPEQLVYLRTTPKRALAEAEAAENRAVRGLRRSVLDGVPISWKDLYDTTGDITSHGSRVLQSRVAKHDAKVVKTATMAGLVCLGKTNQTEFAFSILGINPGFGTPRNPFDEKTVRLPGGSSSGAAVSVSRGLAAAAIGSDTGGSVRVPAAWNGLVGLKTSFGLLPLDGVLGLSTSMDTVGPLTHDVADANALLAILAGKYGAGNQPPPDLVNVEPKRMALALPRNLVWEQLDASVEQVTNDALNVLRQADIKIRDIEITEFDAVESLISHFGPYHTAECHSLWSKSIEEAPELVSAPILDRIRLGSTFSGSDIENTKNQLAKLSESLHKSIGEVGILVMPTVAIGAPPLSEVLESMDSYRKTNAITLRNTRLSNFLNCTALTIPCGKDINGIPVGLMLVGPPGSEGLLLSYGRVIEELFLAS